MIRWVSAQAYQDRLEPREWRRITATFTLVALPLFFFLPSLLAVLLAVALALKFVAIVRADERLAITAALGLMLIGGMVIYGQLRTLGLTLSFVALLVTMSVCKLLESRNRRDVHVLFLLETLLMLAFLMFSQSILIFLYLLFALAISVHGLVRFEQLGRARLQFARWRDLLRLFLIALPFAAAMFFLFPRIQPLWGMPQQGKGAVTGLPDEMNMGDLSSLAQSNEIAFRVRFADDKVPDSRNLYWRGPVLWHFDGKQWLQRRGDLFRGPAPYTYQKDSVVHYELTPVKAGLKWLPALDLPLQLPPDTPLGSAFQIAMPRTARSVGIPARVVIGYQGGARNPLNGDWVVREESAHAWAELWLDGEGWVRFDPTAAVAPNRILQGQLSGGVLTAGEDSRAFGTRIAENLGAVAWLRNAMDATQAFWQDWVIDLDRDQQNSLLQSLGLQEYGSAALIFVLLILLGVGSAILYWLWTRRPRSDDDAVARALRRKLATWEKRGYSKATAESVAVFFRRIAKEVEGKQSERLLEAATRYEALRYRKDDNASQLLSLLKRIRL